MLGIIAGAGWEVSAGSRRPAVDTAAMHEAMESGTELQTEGYASAAAYANFLQARLEHHDGDHQGALKHLRLALATDDGNPYLLTQMAEEYARLSDLDRAEATLRAAIDKAPNYEPAQLMMGRVLFEGQKLTRARAHLQRAIKLKPNEPDAYLVLTQLWLDLGKTDEAVKTVDELAAALPGEPIGYRRLGLALAERGDAVRAERLLNKATDRDPGDSESWVALAQIYDQSNRLEKAEEAYSRALERDSENTDLLLALGRLALRQDSVVRAKAYFEQLLSLSRDPELAVKVAFSYLATRHPAEAAEVLDSARVSTTEPRLHFYAGLVHERMRDFPRAALAFGAVPKEAGELYREARVHQASALSSAGHHKQALELFNLVHAEAPDDATVIAAWSRAYERAGQSKDAETVLKTALNDRPSPDVFEALAELYQREGRLADAVTLLSDALKKRPKDEVLLYTLGTVYERKGDFGKSLEKMRAVLDVNPDNANAMNFIGYTLADRGADFEEAEKLLTRALELKPDNGNYLDSLGWVYFRKGDLQKAAEVLERAQSASPGEPTICEHLGDVYSRLSRQKEAADSYKRALQSLKEDPDQADSPAQRTGIEKKLRALSERP